MRRTILLLAGVLLSVVALGSDSPKEYDDKADMDEVRGTWRLVDIEVDGHKWMFPHQCVMTNRSGISTYVYSHRGTIQGTYRIDPTCKPSRYDNVPLTGSLKGQTLRWIYAIDGDTLRIANLSDGSSHARPQEFNDKGLAILTYKRVK
jgi:uncharacterized protein (TIGR03067 family)